MHKCEILKGFFLAQACFMTAFGLGPEAQAEVRLPKVFGSHMVMQQSQPLTVWGWAQPGETVEVRLDKETKKTQANDKGEWKVVLTPQKAGGPYTLTASGSSTVIFEDVLVGEVWLCSGQSNMEMGIKSCRDADKEIAAADYPQIRLLMVPNRWTPEPQKDMEGTWKVCTPKTVAEEGWGGFSAAGYYFGRELHKQLGVAVGLIDATWGGTVAQTWTPPEGFAAVPALKKDHERVMLGDPRTAVHQQRLGEVLDKTQRWMEEARKALNERALVPAMPTYPDELYPPRDVQHPTALYNGMIHPLCPFALRGAIWYQGESNLGEGALYTERMKALISGWRQVWGLGDFPFYFTQIAPYNYGGNPATEAVFWEAQVAAQSIPNTGMAVINDIGDLKDIHPANKQEVGRRLALWALAKAYGKSAIVYSGPVFKSMATEGDKLRLSFDFVAGGLKSRDGQPLSWFEIIDADTGGFVKANAVIDGSTVVVSAPEVKKPVAVRYAWHMLAEPNLMNAEGLPTSAFRAGKVPERDLLQMEVAEAKDYQLVYDLDLTKLSEPVVYTVDRHQQITKAFDRIAYFLELQNSKGETQYAYVSMDAFTTDLGKIGVPSASTGARFQQDVSNLSVFSNTGKLTTGANLSGGNIEFWPNNYGTKNSANVPNASSEAYDFGDETADPAEGYGSMQVHNHAARQTLFAINHWREGAKADLGIGNQPSNSQDWTFAANAESYPVRRLRVLVRCR